MQNRTEKERSVMSKFRGVCRWYNSKKGYGFLCSENVDTFIHASTLMRSGINTLNTGDVVEYDVVPNQRSGRTEAANVRLIEQ
jgi:cold shock protein